MITKSLYMILALSLSFLTVGCDKVCKSNIQDFATVQNTTGRSLNLSVCKGRNYGEVQTSAIISGISQEISLGSREGTNIQGGLDAAKSCSASDSKMEMAISLAPASFNDVKLCYSESSKLHIIIEKQESCPTGYLEQTSTGPCENI